MFKKNNNKITEELLISNLSMVDADIISSILESYNIPHIKKSKGTGGLMEIYTGFNNYGIDIYVPSNVFQEATELIDSHNIIENE